MKSFYTLLIGIALSTSVFAVGYSDSHVIKKETVQVIGRDADQPLLAVHQIAISVAETSEVLTIYAPDLGRPFTSYCTVSEKLADEFVIEVRPPPEKVSKNQSITRLVSS